MFFVYLLKSHFDGSFYVGYTTDLARRLEEHNEGLSRYTSRKISWEMVHTEAFETKAEALKREIFLKKQRNRTFYQSLADTGGSVA